MPILQNLTRREQALLALVAKGYQNKEIARELDITVSTVEKHLCSIYVKIGVSNRTEAAFVYWKASDVY